MTDGPSEQDIMRRMMIAVSKAGARIFRNNVGLGWVGKSQVFRNTTSVTVYPGDVVVRQARPLHAGLFKGSGDLIGVTPVIVQAKHIGTKLGVFTSLESKTPRGKINADQETWAQQINSLGGIAGIVRDDNDALSLISRHQ